MTTNYTASVIAFGDSDLVTQTYTYQAFPLGLYREEGGNGYRFCQMDAGGTAAVAKRLAYHVDGTYKITATVANAAAGMEAGFFVSVIPASNWGWVQTKGLVSAAVTAGAGTIVAGDSLAGDGSGPGKLQRIADPGGTTAANIGATGRLAAQARIAVALAAESASAVNVYAIIE